MPRAKAPANRTTTSWASSPATRSVMRGNRSRDTQPELALRSAVHALGLRYRVGVRPVPEIRRTADLVFARPKVAVFLDGCFWHGCADHHRPATRNSDFWSKKINANRTRDAETDKLLADAGWTVIRIWEHEQPQDAARRVADAVIASR
ncbi:MAG: very short patch repair endonuclease [Micromonosporaceae bacterium]